MSNNVYAWLRQYYKLPPMSYLAKRKDNNSWANVISRLAYWYGY